MKSVPMSILSPHGEGFRKALARATGALFRLDTSGVTVIEATIRGGRATLRIDRPPPFVTGALTIRRPSAGHIERVLVALYQDCVLEWNETAELARQVSA